MFFYKEDKMEREELKRCARRIMLDITEEDYEKLEKELKIILDGTKGFSKIENLEQVEPLVFPIIDDNKILREDKAEVSLDTDDVLRSSAYNHLNQIKIPKVVD